MTLLVYYSGGVSSWFWSMYSLFILEAAFILPGAATRGAWRYCVWCFSQVTICLSSQAFCRTSPFPSQPPSSTATLSTSQSATSGRLRYSPEPPRWPPNSWASNAAS